MLSLKIGYKTNTSTFVTLIEHIAEVLEHIALKQEKKCRSEKKQYLSADDMTVYVTICKESTKK